MWLLDSVVLVSKFARFMVAICSAVAVFSAPLEMF